MKSGPKMPLAELLALPVSVDLTTAARAFGLGRSRAFELARDGQFPCRVLHVGTKYRVPRSAIFEALGIDPAQTIGGAGGDAACRPGPLGACRNKFIRQDRSRVAHRPTEAPRPIRPPTPALPATRNGPGSEIQGHP